VLHLAPDAFWRMTPRELAHALHALGGGAAPFARDDLDALLRRFPDAHSTSSRTGRASAWPMTTMPAATI
jgi:uncharacterized phage protein (TIGR02216 family)